MNFVGHIAIGVAVGRPRDDVTFLLGTALPDFATMARIKLDRSEGALGNGIQLHHDTDAVFHRQAWFLDLEHALFDEILAAGVPRGGALTCAHVGVELLLDGELLGTDETAGAVRDVYHALTVPPDVALAAVEPSRRARWQEHLGVIARRLDPFLYRDPDTVAVRLQRITASRRLLAFGPEHVPTVAALLAAVQPEIAATAPEVLATVAGSLR